MIEILKAILFGVLEGVTEWLPISSTGHLIILNEVIPLNVTPEFWDLFEVVIQFGAIFAALILFWNKLWPFSPKKSSEEKKDTWTLLFKIVVAILPSVVFGLFLDDWFNATFYNCPSVAAALIIYGVAFIVIERKNKDKVFRVNSVDEITFRDALLIGLFQVLAVVPGTSRSGSTILGAILIGLSRPAAAEFTFLLAIPTMIGASVLKGFKYLMAGFTVSGNEHVLLVVATVAAFAVSIFTIKFLISFVKRRTFAPFGVYRIVLGVTVLAYWLLK